MITKLAVGGAQMNTLISARDISAMGYPSTILTGPEKPLEGNLFHLAEEWGLRVLIAPHLKRSISPLNDLLAYREILREIRTGGYDIVHTHGSKARVLGRMAGAACPSVRVVETAHGWPFYDTMNPLLRRLYVLLEKIGLHKGDAFIVVSPRDAVKAAAQGIHAAQDYKVIRSGVSFDSFVESRGTGPDARKLLGLDDRIPVVGTVMRFCPEKAPNRFVEVAARVLESHPDAMFVMIGDGPLFNKTRTLIADMGLDDRVLLPGARGDIHRLIPAFDVFLITSRTEGLPRTLLEALAANLPIVSTDVGGIGEIVMGGCNGILCPEGDIDALTQGVLQILGDPGLAVSLMKNVDRDLAPFSSDRMVADLYSLYTDVFFRRLRVALLCDDEPVNIPAAVFSIIRRRPFNDYSIVSLPGHGAISTPLLNLKRYSGLYGPLALPLQIARFLLLKAGAALNLPTRVPHSLKQAASRTKSSWHRCGEINGEKGLALLGSIAPDVIVSIACPQILSRKVLDIPRLGAWNIHSAMLPNNRGMLPTFWSLYNGDHPGVTMHRMARKLDDGDILIQRKLPVGIEDMSLHQVLYGSKRLAVDIVAEGLDMLEDGEYVLKPNPSEGASVNRFPSRSDVRHFLDMGGRITGSRSPRPFVGLSFDIEEWFQSSAARKSCPESSWSSMSPRVNGTVSSILDLLAHHKTRATFFVLGWIMERFPDTVRAIADAGHEIASHGYGHTDLTRQDSQSFARELQTFREIAESLSLPPPDGFRAPSFSIMPETAWAVDVLVSQGYTYDSSIYPMFRHRYGIPYAPLEPFMLRGVGAEILELPMASLQTPLGKLPVAGGAYMRFMPGPLHRMFLRSIVGSGRVPVLYLHPWELDKVNTSMGMSPLQRFRQHHNSGRGTLRKIQTILRKYRGIPLRDLAAEARENGVEVSLDLGSRQ